MTTVELLKAARKRIEDPARWTQGWSAKTASGKTTMSYRDDAVCWCAVGAVCAEESENEASACEYLRQAAVLLGFREISLLNDKSNHATVLKMFGVAISAAEATA